MNNVLLESLPPVINSAGVERTHFCIILGMGQIQRARQYSYNWKYKRIVSPEKAAILKDT